MTDRQSFDGRRQRAVLLKLRLRVGKELTELSRDVGLSYPQLLRYTSGKSPLRADQIPAFARAYGVDPVDLAAEIAGHDVYPAESPSPDTPDWSLESELRAAGLDDELIRQTLDAGHGEPELIQRALARHAIAIYQSGRYQGENHAPTRRRA